MVLGFRVIRGCAAVLDFEVNSIKQHISSPLPWITVLLCLS